MKVQRDWYPPHERTDQCGLIQQEPTDTSCGLWVDGMW